MKNLKLTFIILLISIFNQSKAGIYEVLTVKPIYENKKLKGYYIVSRDLEKFKKTSTYTISKCDVSMKPIISVQEPRNMYDDVISAAVNDSALCVIYNFNGNSGIKNVTNGEAEIVTYSSRDLKQLGTTKLLNKVAMWHINSTIVANGNSGFIFTGMLFEDKVFKGIIHYDNKLNIKWTYENAFNYEEKIIPLTYTETIDQNLYSFYVRKAKLKTPKIYTGLLINKVKDGNMVLNHEFNSEDIKIVEKPALYSDGKNGVLFAQFNLSKNNGNFLMKANNERGLLFLSFDLTTKKTEEKLLSLESEEFLSKLDESDKIKFKKGGPRLNPIRATKIGENYFLIGETYNPVAYDVLVNFTSSHMECSDRVFVAEFDKNLNLRKINFFNKTIKTFTTPNEVSHSSTYFTGSFLDMRTNEDKSGFTFRYIDYTGGKTADHITVTYNNGNFKTTSLPMTRARSDYSLNALEGKPGKINVIKRVYNVFEIAEE
ncbi:hypothetical protein [Sporocytophaga myxococcoides]|nr:hypothetical protein [Sporocytophaga myxococcoides]